MTEVLGKIDFLCVRLDVFGEVCESKLNQIDSSLRPRKCLLKFSPKNLAKFSSLVDGLIRTKRMSFHDNNEQSLSFDFIFDFTLMRVCLSD
jgi:hypothetical protein